VVIVDGARDVMAVSTVLLTASGTATVEAMILGAPMVVTYRLSALTWLIAKAVVTVQHAAIPNIMAGEGVVPELLQKKATPQAMSAVVLALLHDRARRDQMAERLRQLSRLLGAPGAALRAAQEVLAVAGRPVLIADSAFQ
jgi:lipid-A-disaccharide synthase